MLGLNQAMNENETQVMHRKQHYINPTTSDQ